MADKILDISDLTLHYGSSQILNGVSLSARAGQVTCVMGTNGVGKTSLLKAISGTHPISGGRYLLNGAEILRGQPHHLAQNGVAYVPQGREIFPFLTVQENLETGFACLSKEDHYIPDDIFDLFPILHDFLARRGGDLSGGQQQQLAIARALITRPRLLLLDEPTEGIQPNIIKHIGTVIEQLRTRGDMAIVLVEQFLDFAYALGDSFVVLERGSLILEGKKSEIPLESLQKAVSI